jgi:LysM repeat protein
MPLVNQHPIGSHDFAGAARKFPGSHLGKNSDWLTMFCQLPVFLHAPLMKLALQLTAAGLSTLFLASCGSSGLASSSGNPTGPFDSRGNYIEDWADNPSKWKKGSASPSKPGESLVMTAANDEPPANSVPLPTASNTPDVGDIGSAPVVVASRKSSSSSTSGSGSNSKPVAATKPKPRVTANNDDDERPRSKTASAAKAKPKAKTATASKTPPKKKTVTTRYTIKKGDTLSGIASRFGTTVGALKSANGISGSVIQPGKSLVVSKR